MTTALRYGTLLGAISFAAASQAVNFSFSGQTLSGASTTGSFTTNTLSTANSDNPFNTITSGLVTLASGTPTANSVVFTNGANTVTVSFPNPTITPTSTQSALSATGTITAGTGVFGQYVSSTNLLTVTSNTFTGSGLNFFSVIGTVNATPEPASMGALAIGALALVRRRRRA